MDIGKIYKMRIFSLEDVANTFSITKNSAAKALIRWKQKGIIQQIRKNMYTAVDLASSQPIVDKYEVASHVSTTSYVGWHSALEYHGLAHQSYFVTHVGNEKRFNKFTFEGNEFEYFASPIGDFYDSGIINPEGNPYVRVTDLERTFVDCCDKINRAGGAEELLHCCEGLHKLNEIKIMKYLDLYGKAFLYQKVGFLLERIQKQINISTETIELCRNKGALHTKRLTNDVDSDCFVSAWKLYVPSYYISENTESYDLI